MDKIKTGARRREHSRALASPADHADPRVAGAPIQRFQEILEGGEAAAGRVCVRQKGEEENTGGDLAPHKAKGGTHSVEGAAAPSEAGVAVSVAVQVEAGNFDDGAEAVSIRLVADAITHATVTVEKIAGEAPLPLQPLGAKAITRIAIVMSICF